VHIKSRSVIVIAARHLRLFIRGARLDQSRSKGPIENVTHAELQDLAGGRGGRDRGVRRGEGGEGRGRSGDAAGQEQDEGSGSPAIGTAIGNHANSSISSILQRSKSSFVSNRLLDRRASPSSSLSPGRSLSGIRRTTKLFRQ